jgi:hypothetical protein
MANQNPDQDRQDPIVEEPGDTDSADIVGRTGEQMPQQSHDGLPAEALAEEGLESDERDGSADVDEADQAPAGEDRSPDNPRAGRVADW